MNGILGRNSSEISIILLIVQPVKDNKEGTSDKEIN
jgi:hypothetical protein